MMFLDPGDGSGDLFAISQPAHAWVSGQLLQHWADALDQGLLLAAEQHDLAWLDWERAPSFDPVIGLPSLFRHVGAASHAPRWAEAVERAEAAWGARVALLISRHGTLIYTRFQDRHRTSAADAAAAAEYVARQAPKQAAWARLLGLPPARLERDTDLIALADTLSLGLCGGLQLPLEVDGPGVTDGTAAYGLQPSGSAFGFTLSSWPFRGTTVTVTIEARRVPNGRFGSEAAMRTWSREAASVPLRFTIAPSTEASTAARP